MRFSTDKWASIWRDAPTQASPKAPTLGRLMTSATAREMESGPFMAGRRYASTPVLFLSDDEQAKIQEGVMVNR